MTKMTATPIYGKPFKNLLLQNQKASDLRTLYVALGMWDLLNLFKLWSLIDIDLFNVKVKFTSKWDFFFWKVDLLNTVKAKVIILTWYVKLMRQWL